MLGFKLLPEMPVTALTRKLRKEIDHCERRVQAACSMQATGLVNAYQRSIAVRKELLSNLDEVTGESTK